MDPERQRPEGCRRLPARGLILDSLFSRSE
jgi:hypothetical protein